MRTLSTIYLALYYLALGVIILANTQLVDFPFIIHAVAGNVVMFTLPLFIYLHWRYLRSWGEKYPFISKTEKSGV